jgi:thymidylate synthase ThyX
MLIKIIKTKDWDFVLEAALYTQGKEPIHVFPSEAWKKKTVIAQHSPLRQLEFMVKIEHVPNFIHNHLVRHVHLQPYIRTMREDLTGVSSDKITRNTHNNGMYIINAQEVINVSKARLCHKASKETREVWEAVVNDLSNIEPLLASMCVPKCICQGYCDEYQTCGLYGAKWQYNERLEYLFFTSKE